MINAPGIHEITAEAYHADPCPEPSLSASVARVLLQRSPLHAWHAHPRLNPRYAPDDSSRFDLGSAAHAMLLEGDHARVAFIDAPDWRTKPAKEARDAARAEGRLPVLEHHEATLSTMLTVARAAVAASELPDLLDGDAERALVWLDGSAWCRSRLDMLSTDRRVILDYKTCASAEPEMFIRQIGNMGYDVQAEFYLRGLEAITGEQATFIFLAQEIEEPFACSLVSLANVYREIAQRKVERAIDCWGRCLQAGRWPAYGTRVHYAEPPPWAMNEHAAREAMESGEWQ